MDAGAVGSIAGPLFFFAFLAAVILVPIWLRNRLYALQLDVIAKAIERGIDPERIQLKLPKQDDDDPNGNWKAGWILIAIGVVFSLCVIGPLSYAGELGSDADPGSWAITVVPGTLFSIGALLLFFHRTIVGKVYRRDEPRPSRGAGQDAGGLV
jgi:hypothetical protein